MASFYAELQVAGATYPVRSCSYGFTQATGARGRVVAKVRPDLVYVTMDVPRDGIVEDWAGAAYKPLAGCLVCYDAKGGPALETLSWTAGHCVGYQEDSRSGNDEEGAYVCHLTIAASTLTWQAGGPGAYRPPTPGEYGQPVSATAALSATAKLQTEEAATGLLKKVINPAGEVSTEFLGVSLAAIARTASLTLGILLTPTNSPDDPGYASEWELYRRNRAQFPTATPDQLRLAQLEHSHKQGALTTEEEAELITLLAKVKGIRVQRLADLNATGPLRGTEQPLPGFYLTDLAYTKRPQADVAKLRSQFSAVRKQFVKDLAADPIKVAHLRKIGMSDADFELMAKGGVPKLYRVHHKLPLDDGGDNSVTNLMLIEDDPWHLAITNLQNVNIVGLQPGQTINLKWPMYNGDIYP